ncbi:Hsp70 family protein [Thalassospira sp.]|uniref:Hsp70 family protein n=1 Tax=Thalassospira sp. TaxID=1912094 RepID=UPI003AA85578
MTHVPIGIDLGTTNSLVAAFIDGEPKLIPNALGEYLTPSVVSIENKELLVGQAARDRLLTHPKNTAAVFKRKMGTDARTRLGGDVYSPEDLSSLVLAKLRQDAEAYLGCEIRDVVVSVPAYFNQTQRRATQKACALAGLNLVRLVNEPTAAALAYGVHQRNAETQFLIVDLGGGTFDVTILEMFDGVMEVKASSGDAFLGGEDFTEALAKMICEKLDFPWARLAANVQSEIRARANTAKIRLSDNDSWTVSLTFKDKTHEIVLTREAFEAATKPILRRMLVPIERCMYDTGMEYNELDRILLVGGATRMPMVRHMVTRCFSKFPEFDIDPDHAVALGAAIQAALASEDRALDDIVVTDVSPFSVGIEISEELPDGKYAHGLFAPIIERNTPLPASRNEVFSASNPRQPKINAKIYQGEAAYVSENVLLGKFLVKLPTKSDEPEAVDVLLTYDTSGLLEVETTVLSTGDKSGIVIEALADGLSDKDMAARLEKMKALKVHPRDNEVNQALINRLRRVHQMVLGQTRTQILRMIAQFDAVLNERDPKEIERVRGELEDILDEFDDLYVS